MDCRDYRRLASKLHDGEGSPAEEKELELHLAACAGCLDFARSLEELDFLHNRLDETAGPAGLADRVLGQTVRKAAAPAWWRAAVAVAAAAVIVLGVWTGSYLTGRYTADLSDQQAELFEMQYFEAYPPGSLGETVNQSLEGGSDV